MKILFPHEKPREQQQEFMDEVVSCLERGQHMFCHAPTGLGKTAAALAPAISYAREHKKKVLFLTSRYTQHQLALQTVKDINQRHGSNIICSDIIAKRNMCLYPQAQGYSSGEFTTFCQKMRESGQCKYFIETRKANSQLTPDALLIIEQLIKNHPEASIIKSEAETAQVCPYEIASEVGRRADVIIGDYYYAFHPKIRESFLRKIGCALEDCVIIVDEAHNLPNRIKELASAKLSSYVLDQALKETIQFSLPDAQKLIRQVISLFERFGEVDSMEQVVPKKWFVDGVEELQDYDIAIDVLDEAQTIAMEQKQRVFLATVHDFFLRWLEEREGFVRIIQKGERMSLDLRCLDPRILTIDVAEAAQVIMMSGTLQPLELYKTTLGFDDARELVFKNPFPKENALHLIVPKTTTRYAERSEQMYSQIAKECAQMANTIPGNVAIFLPSYMFLKRVQDEFIEKCAKTTFVEHSTYQKEERRALLETFKQYQKSGAVLLAVSSGSFGEGVDLPGDLLKGVIVVGLPLAKPDLETHQLIKYYDEQFGNGWDYGYIFPAFNTLLQNAGRCIRSNTDKGVIVYLDKRFGWSKYVRYFPKDIQLRVSEHPTADIGEFFLQ